MNEKEVLLIHPPVPKSIRKGYLSVQIPLGLGYIANSLIACGASVSITDFVIENYNSSKFLAQLEQKRPILVGFTSNTCSIPFVNLISRHIKRHNPQIVTVLGGSHASALPEETLRDLKYIDIIVIGEGEITIKELYKQIQENRDYHSVKGIAFRDNGNAVVNNRRELINNLDATEFNAFSLFDVDKYQRAHVSRGFSRKDLNIMELLTSRGCPNNCIFCAGHINYGNTLRFRSLNNIIKEIERNSSIRKIEHISIEDDTFTLNRNLVIGLSRYLKSKNISWNCNTRIGTVDEDLVFEMAGNNCRKISFGVESGSERILKLSKKNITIKQIIDTFKLARKAKIRFIEANFMLGSHPDENLEDIAMTEKLIFKLKPDFLALAIMVPFPGTETYAIMKKSSLLPKRINWLNFNLATDKPPYKRLNNISAEQLLRWRNHLIKKYYTSPAYILKQLVKMRNIRELRYLLRVAGYFLH